MSQASSVIWLPIAVNQETSRKHGRCGLRLVHWAGDKKQKHVALEPGV